MKRFLTVAAVTIAVIIGGYFLLSSRAHTGHVDAKKIIEAAHAYSNNMKAQNHPLPESVSLQELITKGFLKREDVSAFDGMDVTVSLTADESNPQAVLMWARLSDKVQIVALTDGSVAQVAK